MSDYPIHAYLSYRCKLERDIDARNKLKAICETQGIKLVYDEDETKEGDSLIKFMDDLTSARFVFLFLSPEYFKSGYTMYEFVSLYEFESFEQRWILPVRLCENMVEKIRPTIQNFWFSNKTESGEARYKFCDLAKCSEDKNTLWNRINQAWDKGPKKFLDEKHTSLESVDADKHLEELATSVHETVKNHKIESSKLLQEKVAGEIEQLLKNRNIRLAHLTKALKLSEAASDQAIASFLVNQLNAITALNALIKVTLESDLSMQVRSDAREKFFDDMEQVCGWLLINTVDPEWWFQNELRLISKRPRGITGSVKLQHRPYLEVVISRGLLRQAQYSLDEEGQIKVARRVNDAMTLVFDSISPGSTDISLLSDIYIDLTRADRVPQDPKDLLVKIERAVLGWYDEDEPAPIFYIVSEFQLELMKSRDWFTGFESRMAGYLQFICCDILKDTDQLQASKEDQVLLLEKVANILRLRKSKSTAHG
ncbi:toll/interleukin-1 receptor domain-containing protein [Methylomonas sp. MV1]|uniref:toll/interleukin-1 receptor domain-containing protein n=1 Tax=Methylomonas sp. MV1 TaxID=3073620 RepID=UPI0028A57A1A|nr:toll/interleukin-1 receptor domain-containing protein [Methylomonas sp. MV1]MDT4329106.1 toll/interleukin-1 receptor domain-containing protein [Methylomonas sp. MV1]